MKLFISYSTKDTAFVEKLEQHLQAEGFPFWRDAHDMKAGRIEKQIDRAIGSLTDVVVLIFSKHSVDSDWVEWEVEKAREKEKKGGDYVLCPVALDDSWKTCRWEDRLRMQIQKYLILNFSNWTDDAAFGALLT